MLCEFEAWRALPALCEITLLEKEKMRAAAVPRALGGCSRVPSLIIFGFQWCSEILNTVVKLWLISYFTIFLS